MSLPSYQDYYPFILKFADKPQTADEYLVLICSEMGISDNDQEIRNPSGEPTVRNRLRWGIHYLRHAKLIDKPQRGKFVITERGRQVRAQYGEKINNKTLEEFDEFRLFKNKKTKQNQNSKTEINDSLTPIENIEESFRLVNQEIKFELQSQIYDLSPYFFEKSFLDLLIKMGYGNFKGTRLTNKSRDGGVDGIVYQDVLGLEIVYIQAKRYQEGNNIGRTDLQKFIGSLSGMKASKGFFFTLSDFTKDALEYLESIQQKIVCINGDELIDLLIEYKVGVQVRSVYETYKIDEDYFSK